jgi:hypothetical protein
VRRTIIEPSAQRQVRVGGLPLCLEPGSLRARVLSGTARVLDVRPQFDVQLAEEIDVPAEVKALEAARETLARLQLRRARLEAEVGELQGLRPSYLEQRRGDPPRVAPVAAMIELADFTDAQLERRLAERRAVADQVADAERDVALRQRRLAEASSTLKTERARLSRVAVLMLAEAPTAPLELAIEYQVPGVRWVPGYQLKLERGLGAGTLSMRASIAQDTGEDWSQVTLALSTATLQRRTDVPELRSLRIGRAQAEPPRSGWRAPPAGLDALFEGYDSVSGPRLQQAMPPPAPPPPPKPAPKQEPEKAKKAMMPPSAPPPMPQFAAPVASARGGASMVGGMASAMRASMPAPAAPGAVPMRRRAAMETADLAPSMDFEEDGAMAELSAGGGGDELSFGGAPAAPQFGLDAALLDYSRLTMIGVDGGGPRGQLRPMGQWDSMFAVGVSVQVEVVVSLVAAAQQRARSVGSLGLPANTNPVSAIDSFDYRYACAGRLDVPSTGKWVTLPVSDCQVGLTPEYVCVPSVEPKVFRTLSITNRSQHALLPGPVDVTVGDDFLLTTALPAVPPRADATHRLGLGVEEAIKVSRKTNFKETSGGFLGGSTLLPHEIEIELKNGLASTAAIEVRERIPWVSPEDEKDVKIEEPQVQPPWERLDKPIDGQHVVRGARRWKVTVAPGQTQKLTAQFTIRLPADRMVVGGNRRS